MLLVKILHEIFADILADGFFDESEIAGEGFPAEREFEEILELRDAPKGSFNALIYLHRYRPDTVSIVLNDYLREFMTKLRVQRNHLIDDNNRADLSASEKSANLKRIDKYAAMLAELEDYERDILFPLAQKQLAIDLDDGVKVNYLRFGAALKEIPGLKAREE